ncbi:ABC transporter permease [Aetokthonos hydrillicola Thurmond2011]|uniref:ABC transporter permease n=1 Tax=Aetokthonos hydrillicola Thurmond2011 TaxID=2712845 RepID=A0AAP5I4H9_9CYAN|nr:ABC transporter permease [Aetokthonos hydrillicola]MDR9894601.1 ABC transporter permease [Aetokthonos hydrillicola Thurmond2011]
MSAETLWSNKLRTGLTMLGVIIGISSVIAITAVGQGVQRSTELQIQALGTNVMLVLAGAARTGGISQGAGSASTLTWEESQAIAKQVPAAKEVSAFLQKGQIQVVRGNNNAATTLLGTDLKYPSVKNIHPQLGLFFSQGDLDAARPVAFLGSKVRDEMFKPDESVIGADLRIRGNRYTVVGVAESKGSVGNQDLDDQVYIPLTNMSAQIVGNNALTGVAINGFWLEASDVDQLNSAQFQVTNILRLLHRIHPPDLDDFRIINQVDIINTFTNVVGSFTLMVGAIAGISLVVGGIGIANIMLVSVMERTREIGIRKAVGATSTDILSQFLTEAIVISTVGGLIGVGLGITLAFGAATLFKFPFIVPLWSIGVGFGLSFIVGILAGGIPARNAAKLDPISALHNE